MKHPQSSSWFLPSQAIKREINPQILSWLEDEGSLTLRLKTLCPDQFSVVVLAQQWCKPEHSEQLLLGLRRPQRVLLREVHLKCADNMYVYARSVIPMPTLKGKHRRLLYLGSKPLGEYLFSSPRLKRSRIEWSKLTPDSSLYQKAMANRPHEQKPVWGRRSLFHIDNKPLLVSEFFLPDLFEER